MKKITTEEMVTQKHHETILVCKEEETKGKTATKVFIKANLNNTEENISKLNLEEMIELAKNNTSLYCEKLILAQFADNRITEKSTGTSYILPKSFQRFYDKCISFGNDSYQVYFPDLSINYFRSLIDKLEARRTTDSLEYCSDAIKRGIVRNLKLSLSDGFSFQRLSYCTFDKNSDRLLLDPRDTLYYQISKDENGNFNQADLENMSKILEMFAATKQNCHTAKWDDTDVVGHFHGGGSVLVAGYKNHPELFHQVNSLVKRKEDK